MSGGIYLEDLGKRTKKCEVKKIDKFTFSIILTQGLNRQIRRMCDYLNYEVQTLKRVRIMNVKLDISSGQYRELTKEEFEVLNALISDSIKTFQPKTINRSNNF
jgi:23S rRNA pseudouridine2604 synthase